MRLRSLLLLHWPAALLAAGCGDYRTIEPPPPPPIPVVGQVQDIDGLPVPGVIVAAGDSGVFDRATTTDADGRFLLWAKRLPYDLAVVASASGIVERATVYRDVTRTDPMVVAIPATGHAPSGARSATLTGTIAAACGAAPCPTGYGMGQVVFEPGPGIHFLLPPWTGPVAYQLSLTWGGPATLSGHVHALTSVQSTLGSPVEYWYGTEPATVTDGAPTTVDLPPLQPTETAPLTGTIAVPAGATADYIFLWHSLANSTWIVLARGDPVSSATFAYDVPAIGAVGTGIEVTGTAAGGEVLHAGWSFVRPGSTGLTVELRPAPVLLEPAAGATGVGPGVRLAWTPVPGAMSVAALGSVLIYTASAETVVPDFSALGLGYPAGAAGTWSVTNDGWNTTVDGVLAPLPPPWPHSWWQSASLSRPFSFR